MIGRHPQKGLPMPQPSPPSPPSPSRAVLTLAAKTAYLKSQGTICPFCQSPHITAGILSADGPQASSEITCEACGKLWLDLYTLTGITSSPHGDYDEESEEEPDGLGSNAVDMNPNI
jgi:hypothetical protein